MTQVSEAPGATEWRLEPNQPIPKELLDTIQVKHLGPVWEENPNWNGVNLLGPQGKYILPEFSLGHQGWAWVRENLNAPDASDEEPMPFTPTFEQYRFVLWWYAVDERGRFLFRRGVMQRLKGWGKDPIAAVISAIELLGPCRFKGWATRDLPQYGLDPQGKAVVRRGLPVAVENPTAWVQIAAVTKVQTANTLLLFPALFNQKCREKAQMRADSIGVSKVTAFRGRRQIQAVTSNPRALEGGRPSLVIKNECLSLDTSIPTPLGWTTMGELKDGDVIFGSDGQPTTVVKALPVQLDRRCFEVTFVDGTSLTASDGHLWQTRVLESDAKPRVRTTLEMFEDGRKFGTPRPGPRVGVEESLPLDPYILGAWLGDGSSLGASITSGESDTEELERQLALRGLTTHRTKTLPGKALEVSFGGTPQAKALRKLPCLGDKHIPEQYLRASVEQRLELLRGLMDTDGCISSPQGQCIFAGRERLAMDFLELIRGLGQLGRATFVKDSRSKEGGYWRVTFTPQDIQPFSFPRKMERVRLDRVLRRDWVSIKSIKEVESVPVRCIAVDAPNRLFQAGEAGHVTHNTEHWIETNNGWAMDKAIDRNAAKSRKGAARSLAICNAPEPSEESVGLKERNAYLRELEGTAFKTGVLYDSLELAESVTLYPPGIDHLEPEFQEPLVYEWIEHAIKKVRGDSWWLDPERIAADILDTKDSDNGGLSEARRFFFNQTIAAEDAWVLPQAVDLAVDPLVGALRTRTADVIRIGWEPVRPDEPIVMFFDGSKSDDATALIGCRLSDGYTFTIGIWQAPPGRRRRGKNSWLAPRGEVDTRVDEAFERFTVVAFWADPSHAKDDEDGAGYWDGLIDEWHRLHKNELLHWSTKTGAEQHSILWDMSSPQRTKMFVAAAERTVAEFEHRDEHNDIAPTFAIDGNPRLMEHLKNAKMAPSNFGVGLRKEGRESLRKIDAAVCLVGARLLRRIVLNAEPEPEEQKGGWAWAE